MNLTILILNIIGTFFLSIEAIKLENLERFRYRLRQSNSILNPQLEWDESNKKQKNKCMSSN
jgi:hypothetical protein